jgi:hypothetical protein
VARVLRAQVMHEAMVQTGHRRNFVNSTSTLPAIVERVLCFSAANVSVNRLGFGCCTASTTAAAVSAMAPPASRLPLAYARSGTLAASVSRSKLKTRRGEGLPASDLCVNTTHPSPTPSPCTH